MVLIFLGVHACTEDTSTTTRPEERLHAVYEFDNGSDGRARQVSDFDRATRPHDVISETGVAPPGFDAESGFFHLGSSNPSDSVFLYMLRRVGPALDLAANTPYTVRFVVTAASNAPSDCAGIGGAPGEAVWLKVGASEREPTPVSDDGETRLAIDKGNQSRGGENADVAGTIGNGISCEEALDADSPYAMVTWEETLDTPVSTDDRGELWLFVGTDSGFEGRTDLYYDRVEVAFEPEEQGGR